MTPRGTCSYCGCTDAHGCAEGCAWADDAHTVCSLCDQARTIAAQLAEVFAVAKARTAEVAFEDLSFAHQRLLVMSCRATVDGLKGALLEVLGEDAVVAALELARLEAFLEAHCPGELVGDEAISTIVMRLLTPHLGSRIVVPSSIGVGR